MLNSLKGYIMTSVAAIIVIEHGRITSLSVQCQYSFHTLDNVEFMETCMSLSSEVVYIYNIAYTLFRYNNQHIMGDHSDSINPWPYLDPFFEYSSRNGNSLKYICQLCKPKCTEISSYINSPSNLGKHVKTVHGQQHYEEYQNLTSRARKRKGVNPGTSTANKQRKVTSNESTDMLLQSSIDYHLISFLIHSHIPFQLVEQPEFKQLITALQPNVGIVSRSTLKQRMDQISDVMRLNIMTAMSAVDYIATTVLCWYSQQRRYIGLTAHWINSTSLQRCTATLACRTLNGSHTYNEIMAAIGEVQAAYNITDKIICTTTGNEQSLSQDSTTFVTDHVGSPDTGEYVIPGEVAEPGTQLADTCDMLSSGSNTNYRLPVYHRCASQILHLIIIKDSMEAEVNDDTFKMLKHGAFTKLSVLWNRLDQSTTNVESIETVCGMQLIRPNQARWSSVFSAIEGIALVMGRQGESALRTIFNFLDVRMLTSTEQMFIQDYCSMMKPVVQAMEMLQSEKNAYMGWLLPTLQELMSKLEIAQDTSHYCKSLASAIIEGIQNRFGMMMVDPLLIGAAILHPKFKTDWTSDSAVIQTGLMYLSQKLDDAINAAPEPSKEDDDSFFTSLNTRNQSTTLNKPSELASYLATESREINMLHSFPTIKNLFILLNTSMPTSASCDKLLSSEELMFTSRYADVGSRDFENQLLMKMNWKYCS